MENTVQKINCQNCGSGVRVWGVKNNFTLYQCIECKLIFVHPLPDPQSVYTEDYFSGASQGFGYVDYDRDKEPMIPVFEKYLNMLAERGVHKGKLFDIGAATGFFLNLARERGFEVSGVEMSSYASELAKKKGVDVASGDLMGQHLQAENFDVITMLDVLEHMSDPFAEIKEVKRILKFGGHLLINTPNGESALSRFLKTRWHLVVPPEHLFYFSPRNLSQFLEKSGFEILYSGTIGKNFTFAYIFKTLYKWQKISAWNSIATFFSKKNRASWSISLNLYDNLFLIARKK